MFAAANIGSKPTSSLVLLLARYLPSRQPMKEILFMNESGKREY